VQDAVASGQRGAKAQPGGMSVRRGGRPGTPHAGRASATGVMAKKASSIFFDGSQAKDLISGISCLS
jgi:hypothetical protein